MKSGSNDKWPGAYSAGGASLNASSYPTSHRTMGSGLAESYPRFSSCYHFVYFH